MSRIVIAGGHLAVWIASLLLLGVDAGMGVAVAWVYRHAPPDPPHAVVLRHYTNTGQPWPAKMAFPLRGHGQLGPGLYCYRNSYRRYHPAEWVLVIPAWDWQRLRVLHIPRKASVAYARAIWLYAAEILPVPVAVRTRYRRWLEDWDAVEAPMAAAPGWVRQVVLRNTEAVRMVWSRTTKQWGVSPS